jgi:hypothetical protein
VERARTHLELAIEVDSDPIRGSVSNGDRQWQPFSGWIELVAAIEAARSAAEIVAAPGEAARSSAEIVAAPGEGGMQTLGSVPGANGTEL